MEEAGGSPGGRLWRVPGVEGAACCTPVAGAGGTPDTPLLQGPYHSYCCNYWFCLSGIVLGF